MRRHQVLRGAAAFIAAASGLILFQNCTQFNAVDGISPFGASEAKIKYSLRGSSPDEFISQVSGDIDELADDCQSPVLKGYKCLDQKITTSEGKVYGIRIKWNRPGKSSRGSFISVGGGTGKGEALNDRVLKNLVEKMDQQDQVRAIFLEFTDDPWASKEWGGCWSQAGGYKSTGLLFRDAVKHIIESLKIPRGEFLNYLGLSNGTMLASYGMSNFGMDRYFDRVVLHAGPVLGSAVEACDVNNPKSIFNANTKERSDYLFGLFSVWLNGDGGAHMCANVKNDDRMSVLTGNKNFPNTHIVTVVGALEAQRGGFGNYHLVSNEDWFNKVSGKSKVRLVPELMGHEYGYQNIRRFLKLDKYQTAQEDTDCPDTMSTTCEAGVGYQHLRRTCASESTDMVMDVTGWIKVEAGHYKRVSASVFCASPATPTPPVAQCSTGQFVNGGGETVAYRCDCPATVDMSTWTKVSPTCYHKVVKTAAKPFKIIGVLFYGDGIYITRRDFRIEGGGPNLKVCLGRNSMNPNACALESEFVPVKSNLGDLGSYDANGDIYYVKDQDLRSSRFPHEKYFSVFILSDGTRQRVEITPVNE